MKNKRHLFLLLLLVLVPVFMEACPLCQGAATEEKTRAYKQITLFLALLPILGMGGIFWWVRRRSRELEN